VCADPDGFSNNLIRDSFNREVAMIEEMSRFGFNLEVVRRHCGSPRDTYSQLVERVQRLVKESAHIVGVHFVGHGSIDSTGGAFVGETKDGEPVSLYAPQIQSALKPIHNLEWVLLNACWSGSAPESRSLAGLATALAVSQKVPTVLAYQMAVDTSDAEVLAAHFYKEGLVGGVSIEEVVWSVRMTCQNPNGLVVLQRSTDRRTPEPRTADGWAGRRYAAPAGFSPQSSPTPRSTQPTEDRAPATHDELILIPAGPFWKGLSREQIDSLLDQFKKAGLPVDMASVAAELSKQPRTQRDLPSFRIGRTPVTNAQFAQFVQATGYVTHAEQVGNSNTWRLAYDGPNKTNHPVILVSASDAEAYCHWANTRLPSLEEWEKAFRGPDGLAYPWGDEFDLAKCNSAETTISPNTTPVGMFATGASPYGCQDMLGNVEEWTSTTEGLRRCIVGGSWRMSCQVFGLPVLHRLAVPSSLFEDTGFRVAKDA
jgi:formylglycine-generating enzyme required for sulfatase activity